MVSKVFKVCRIEFKHPVACAICNLAFFVEARSIEFDFNSNIVNVRPVFPGGAGDAMAPPDFGRSVNPISTRGTDYAHLIANIFESGPMPTP